MTANNIKVAIMMGSASDWPVMKHAADTLKAYGIGCDVRVLSAHRTPDEAATYAQEAAGRGIQVVIAAAGMAAHLAGVVAAHTDLPVLGVPMKGGAVDGLDALLSMVQMPSGVPVACTALGRSGAVNAALTAVRIMALHDERLQQGLQDHKLAMREQIAVAQDTIDKERAAES